MTTHTTPAPSPSTTALPCEREQQYEHRIPKKFPNVIQVRPQRQKGQLRGDWSVYMSCTSHAAALRILAMLAEGESEREVVTP